MTNQLALYDLIFCVRRLPAAVRNLLKSRPNALFVAGGFVRACVAGEVVSDIDIMAQNKDAASASALELSQACRNAEIYQTDNAYTVKLKPIPVQFVHRWTFATPQEAIESFDFTIARAALWWDGETWQSCTDPAFYSDLAAKRLIYKSPVRIEEAGGSMLRVLKFYQRGYRIPLPDLAAVIARLMHSVKFDEPIHHVNEWEVAKVVTGLLREVDPLIDPDHLAQLSALPAVDDTNSKQTDDLTL